MWVVSLAVAVPAFGSKTLSLPAAGPHARYRCPELVAEPLTVDELLVFLGGFFLLGAKNNDVLGHAWCTTFGSDTFRLPVLADS